MLGYPTMSGKLLAKTESLLILFLFSIVMFNLSLTPVRLQFH